MMESIKKMILFEDKNLLILNKAPSLPAVPDVSNDPSVFDMASEYTKGPLFPVNRLDRPTSGIFVLAKTKRSASLLSEQFNSRRIKKEYLAFVSGEVKEEEMTFTDLLLKSNKTRKAYVCEEGETNGKEAITRMKLLVKGDNYTLVSLTPLTGRFHQIRAQLAHHKLPIKGDVKYGSRRKNKDRSIHLHAWKLEFKHPGKKGMVKVVADLPSEPLWNFAKEALSDEIET